MTAPSIASGGRSEDRVRLHRRRLGRRRRPARGAAGEPGPSRAGHRGRARRARARADQRPRGQPRAGTPRPVDRARDDELGVLRRALRPPAGPDPKRARLEPPRNGIFYPRSAALGGCTVHNAMITIAGPDADWDDLADFLDDDSWRGDGDARPTSSAWSATSTTAGPRRRPRSWPGRARDLLKWLFGFDPDHTRGPPRLRRLAAHQRHRRGPRDLPDKQLDPDAQGGAEAGEARRASIARRPRSSAFLKGRIAQVLDPNHARTQAESPEGVVLVPLSVDGPKTTIHQNAGTPDVIRGRRSSPRELLHE